MITRADADASAAAWARAEGAATVEEFDLGFIVTTRAAGRVPGGGTRVIDRATGRVSTWPHWPSTVVEQVYREQRPAVVDPPKTADPEVQLRREARRRITPDVAAHATVEGRLHIARGAKGDQRLHHHPLVLQRLAEQTPGQTVRGCERHAELIVCSDVLHEADRLRERKLTLAEARVLLGAATFETFQIHEPGDPRGGTPNEICESCVYVLTQLNLLPWAETGALYEFRAPEQPNPRPDVYPDVVAAELLQGGWMPAEPPMIATGFAEDMVRQTLKVAGREQRHRSFPAVIEAMTHTGRVAVSRSAAGVEQRSRPFSIGSELAAHSADLLYEFGQVIGAELFPIGVVNRHSVLAVDDRGRVFDLDQAGEWFVGDGYVEAVTTLILGRRTHRVRDDGTYGEI